PLLIAIVAGIVVGNARPLGPRYTPGLAIASRQVLRVGVALLGLQLVFGEIFGLGAGVLVLIVATVGLSLGGSWWIGRLLGVRREQRLLIACGTSICGAAAVAAVAGSSDSDDDDVATAIGTVVVFGTVLMGLIPLSVQVFGLGPDVGGIWVGAAIHEVAQVVAAGGAIGSGALAVAVVVKLGRVLMLAPVLTVISVRQRASSSSGPRPPLVPLFIVGFLGCAAVRSAQVLPAPALLAAGQVQVALLSAAMFALGAGVRLAALRAVGPRPIALGALGAAWIAAVGLVGALLLA
ncbi:MAG: putative sulfate exporter family transporter, partial [Gordonia sp. (in: high G+C Gram-positive bacteria)]|uniref:YeiH family protein n=1 Tax=Gordonia sp. (in: high G+C Gram-positive bacteria) TaxID=84139 RepID=UPI003BB5E7F3